MDALKNVVEVDESGRGLGHQQALNQSTDRSRAQPRVPPRVQAAEHADRRIGTILAAQGKLGGRDVERILTLQEAEDLRFGEAALRLGLITAEDLCAAIANNTTCRTSWRAMRASAANSWRHTSRFTRVPKKCERCARSC